MFDAHIATDTFTTPTRSSPGKVRRLWAKSAGENRGIVADIDQKFLDAISRWKYKPRPAGCGVIENHRLGFIPIKDALLPGFSAYRQLIHRDRSAHRTPSVRQRDIQTGGEHQFILFLTGGRVVR